jgi:DNA repair exonuclease SbcCD ATPase subunit
MILKSLQVANFRKFRDPLRIDGFADGLNIVVEPNETGKSTLLEALRAAFFIRHSAKTELVRSYVPNGDDVAPHVGVEFVVDGQPWRLEKQFMRAPFVRLSGSGGRRENDAAEEALQELLGFERGNNRGSDPETRGPLGMLWVEQAGALAVEGPNRIVRDTVRGVLEAEVGAVTGGRRFDGIRANVEMSYTALRTAKTGQSRGHLAAAEARVSDATTARVAAENALRGFEQSLTELEGATSRLRILERELVDPETAEQRKRLEDDQKSAESAALRLSAAEAHHGRADEIAKAAVSRVERLDVAEKRVKTAIEGVSQKQTVHDEAKTLLDKAGSDERDLRTALLAARTKREACETLLSEARQRFRAFAAAAGARRALDARNALAGLEERERFLQAEVEAAIVQHDLDDLADLERAAIEARARFEAGTVKVDFDLVDGVVLRIDGQPSDAFTIDVLTATRFTIGDAGSLVVRPPAGAGRSIEADRAAADEKLAVALKRLGVGSYAIAVARSERAATAARELKTVRAQIAAACPGDPTIGLARGADSLRAFVASLGEDVAIIGAPTDDVEKLESEVADAKAEEAAADGRHEESRKALSKAEGVLATAAAELDSATREQQAASDHLRNILEDGDRSSLEEARATAQRERVAKLEQLEAANEGAGSYDLAAICKRLENMTRAATRAGEERVELNRQIASLEATVAREGTLGPAGQAEAAREEESAAIAACERFRREANVLEALRSALADAANEASRTFLAPVTRRAARYVRQLLPGCDLSFDEELGLTSVLRAGVDESCGNLSRGTQEQLAILTRLAFADLLLEDGAPISLILDDPFVYSDDARLETMTDILQAASTRMQVILLTCRSKAFRHIDANRIMLR